MVYLKYTNKKKTEKTEHAAVIVQRNVRGHLSRKHNEGAQADLRKAKYRRDMGWDRPPSPIVVPTEAATPTPQKDTTPMELSRVQILVEDIRKLQGENKLLQAKHDKMSKVLIREKRQRTKAEADSIRHQRKIKDSQATIEKLKQALNRLGKEKREADMRHLEAAWVNCREPLLEYFSPMADYCPVEWQEKYLDAGRALSRADLQTAKDTIRKLRNRTWAPSEDC